jgi:hypothetical protein
MKTCAWCGGEFENDKISEIPYIDGCSHLICHECVSKRLSKCDSCERYHAGERVKLETYDPSTQTYTTSSVCRPCSNKVAADYIACAHGCGRRFHKLDLNHKFSIVEKTNGIKIHICPSCTAISVFTCPSCGKLRLKSDSKCTAGGDMYCITCYELMSPKKWLFEYSHKPSPLFHLTDEEKLNIEIGKRVLTTDDDTSNHLFLGVELEIDDGKSGCVLAKTLKNNWPTVYCKKDGSLSDMGIEIVSYPATLNFHSSLMGWDKLCKLCKDCGYESGDTVRPSGMHIHFNRSFLGKTYDIFSLKLASFIHMHPNYTERIARRKNQEYAKVRPARNIGDLKTISKENLNRHDAVNFTNKATIEIRIFKGTLDYETILSNLEIVDSMVRFINYAPSSSILKTAECWHNYCVYVSKNSYRHAERHMKSVNAWR